MKRSLVNSINHFNSSLANKINWSLLMLLLITFLSATPVFSSENFQDEKPYKTKLTISCTQLTDHQVLVAVQLRARVDKQYVPVPDVELEIFTRTDTSEVLLGKGTSNKKGIVELTVNAKGQLRLNEEGYYNIAGTFEGDENYSSGDEELLFKPAILEIEAEAEDSVKTITVKVYEDNEEATPLADQEVVLQVPRMYSNLTIATESTDEEGMVSFEFPNDLPGGQNGELVILVNIKDTDEYASLQGKVTNNWGVSVSSLLQNTNKRELWTPNAPLWMVYTFAILMTLVWGHFIIIIYKLILIRKEGRSIVD